MSCFASPVFSETPDIYKCDTLKDLHINSTTGDVSPGESKSLVFKLDKKNKKISVVGFTDSSISMDFRIFKIKELTPPDDISFSAENDGSYIDYYNGKFSYVSNFVGNFDFLATSVLIAKCHKF